MKRFLVSFGILLLLLLSVNFGYTGQATLSWTAPTTNEDGTPLTDLAGFKLYYSKTAGTYTAFMNLKPDTTAYTISLPDGTWYFAVTAYNESKTESSYSNEVSKTIKNKPSAPTGCTLRAY